MIFIFFCLHENINTKNISWSDIVSVKVSRVSDFMNLFPIPFKSDLMLKFSNEDEVELNIYSLTGNLIFSEVCNKRLLNWNLEHLNNGVYILSAKSKDSLK